MDSLVARFDLEGLLTEVARFAPRLLVAAAVLLAFWILYRVTRSPLRAALARSGLHGKLVDLMIDSVYRYAVFAFGLVMALSQLGVNVGAAITGLGVAGVAVGLAAQDTLANTIAGFTIFWDKPFTVGDWITVAGEYGRVQDITLRSTRIRTPRNSYVVVPNKRIIDEVMENDSKHGEVRVDVPLGIAYKEDTEAARKALLSAVRDLDDAGCPGIHPPDHRDRTHPRRTHLVPGREVSPLVPCTAGETPGPRPPVRQPPEEPPAPHEDPPRPEPPERRPPGDPPPPRKDPPRKPPRRRPPIRKPPGEWPETRDGSLHH